MVYYQNIPKCMAERSENIYFNGKNYQVMDKDPLIAWHFANVENQVEMTYDIKGDISKECVKEMKDFIYSKNLVEDDNNRLIGIIFPIFVIVMAISITLYLNAKKNQ